MMETQLNYFTIKIKLMDKTNKKEYFIGIKYMKVEIIKIIMKVIEGYFIMMLYVDVNYSLILFIVIKDLAK